MTEKITSAKGIKELHDTLRAEMTMAQLRQKENCDHHWKPDPKLQSGDIVWFLPRNVHTTQPSKKLDYKKVRSFKILAGIRTTAYKLAFPALNEDTQHHPHRSSWTLPRQPIPFTNPRTSSSCPERRRRGTRTRRNDRFSTLLQQASIPS